MSRQDQTAVRQVHEAESGLRKLIYGLSRGSKIAVLGIGNELNGDDAAGILAARALKEQLNRRSAGESAPSLVVYEAGPAPENFTGPLRRFHPNLVLMIDAAEMGEPPGTIMWLDWRDAHGGAGSTHTLSPSVLSRFLVEELGCRVILVGIQPAQIEFGTDLSEPVEKAVARVVQEVIDFIENVRII
ncbi:MAG: hydrogenase 3 maturation endopeptidase HyCI [Chloroflexi bacterium]|nr:hydrogenase 3 maturation endopeptidase HyCI [Chloroflexota bacterium]